MTALPSLPWADAPWWQAIIDRTARTSVAASSTTQPEAVSPLTLQLLIVAGVVALAVVSIPPFWRAVRILVTLVHELGHAAVGILVGRRFTGFVVRGDTSGHAVTVGKPRGPGLAFTTWAGYPAPAVVGAALVAAAVTGWAPAVFGGIALIFVLTLPFVRSWATFASTLAVAGATAALWWWRSDPRSATVLLTVAVVLILGAWRHLGAVAPSPRGSDPDALAKQTGLRGWFWVGTFGLVIAAASAGAGYLLWTVSS